MNYPISHPPTNVCCRCGASIQIDREMYGPEGAGRLEMSFGYGSRYDLRNFVAYICDNCVVPFIDSCTTKVGEFCCMGIGQEQALTPNCVVDETFSGNHRQALIDDGVKFATPEEICADLLIDPTDLP